MDRYSGSITLAGGKLLVGTFLVIILYFVISTPLESIFDGLDDADAGEAVDEMNSFLPFIRSALYLAFAIGIVAASMRFVFWVFHREPDWGYRRP